MSGLIKTVLLSTGWLQFELICLAGHNPEWLAVELLETVGPAGFALGRLATCRLDTIEMG
jgi:hypothetical protein